MTPFSRIPSPVDVNPERKPKTPQRSPTKDENSVDCHPWDSRGRRLFPQRRPSIPTSIKSNASPIPGFPLFDMSPSENHSHIDHEEFDSNPSSPSSVESVATVKIHKSPTQEQLLPEFDPWLGNDAPVHARCQAGSLPGSRLIKSPISPHKPLDKKFDTSFSAPLYIDAPARSYLQWKSMAQFHKSRHLLRPRILSLPNGDQGPRDADKSHDPLSPTIDTSRCISPMETYPCQWSQLSQSPRLTARPRLSALEVGQDSGREDDRYGTRADVAALEIVTWDCTVTLSTVATVASNGKLQVHHLALVSLIMPREEVHAEKVSLSFVVANAFRTNHRCSLALGQSSLLFKEDVAQPGFFPREGAELVIERNSCDLEKPLNLYFAFTYPSPWHFVMASLPTFRPKGGKALSEVVFVAEPRPPLSMRTFTRDPLSSWKLFPHSASQVTYYERTNVPRLYPAGFQDDIQMRILELDLVRFRALGESSIFGVVWKLDVMIHELPGGQPECRMNFFIEVGNAMALVSLIPHGWVPRYFIIDGCVATEKTGECWKDKEGHITIFKQAQTGPGPIMIETYWHGPPKHGNDDAYRIGYLPLPRVMDRKILGGRLTCPAHKSTLLNHLGERLCSYGPVEGTYTLLPTMDAGYRILIKCATNARPQNGVVRSPFRPIREDIQLSENAVGGKGSEVNKRHETGLNPTVNNFKEEASLPKHLLQSLLLQLLILLLLVPGFLLFVEQVRRGNDHNERTNWRDQDSFSWDREEPQATLDVAGSDSLQSAVVALNDPAEVVKCEGWRDWIDYGSGWKGCIP